MKIFIAQPLFLEYGSTLFELRGSFVMMSRANLLNWFSFSYNQFNSIQIICSLEFNFQKLNTNEKNIFTRTNRMIINANKGNKCGLIYCNT